MVAPTVWEKNLRERVYHDGDEDDREVIKNEWTTPEGSRKSMEDDLTLAQFSKSKTTFFPSPSTPSPSPPQGKRTKSKQMKDKPSPTTFKNLQKRQVATKDTPGQVRSPTMIRAEEVRSSLGPKFPSCIKVVVRSHVASCFWMGLPTQFCKSFLPKKDTIVVLENENGEQFELKYIAQKYGLSAGWRKFAVGHNLLEGDALIFHLVECHKFKVYIIRENDVTEVDGACSLLYLDTQRKQHDSGENRKDNNETATPSLEIKKRKRQKSLQLIEVKKKNKKSTLSRSVPQLPHPVKPSGSNCEEVVSEVLEGSRTSKRALQFKDIRKFEDFHIVVDGLCIDSELPKHARKNYYELCCSNRTFLHDLLPQGVYYKLVAGIIGETVSIANEIRKCKLTTSREDFAVWEKSLKSFEQLGMNVGFLRNRICKLLSLAFESEGALDTKRYNDAKTEQSRIEGEIRKFEAKLVELKEASGKFDSVIGSLKEKVERFELKFREEVDAPW